VKARNRLAPGQYMHVEPYEQSAAIESSPAPPEVPKKDDEPPRLGLVR
jgi:hypothetical protein